MSNITAKSVKTLLALVLALVGFLGAGTTASASPTLPAGQVSAQAACGDTSGFDVVPLGGLPAQATDTYDLIQTDGPFPFDQDGTVFQNREGLLPSCSSGYYHEYTVITPGSSDRGARRIVTGSGGEYFYTGDHYGSFSLIDV
ncbi:ribonuclease domain-containing protein [Actinokineospora bangkokensis]|uniref:Ribonuclease n=1 Tax=Actinokineospora bangkokensis TaxID=1193682 RepID=A0A1Q9LHS0_9PSEU|nr:ribonuclease domain-containing protein [Actinokineospora bangkokensis]OLR91573.1 ribonuclease [Actinokineospora bangkokensis]